MTEQSDLEKLLAAIASQYPFSNGNYPNMPTGRDGRLLFAVRHIRDHTDKAWGAIAAATEPQDHAESVNFSRSQLAVMAVAAAKLAINAHQLLSLCGVSTAQEQLDAMLATLRPSSS